MIYHANGKVVGEMRNGIYVKRVIRSKHLMKMFQGYGISKSIVVQLAKDGCREIRINEDGEILYRIPYDLFVQKGIEKNFDDLQVFCSLKYFTSKDLKQASFMVE